MERLRETTANIQTVEEMSHLLEDTLPHRHMLRLRKYARDKLDAGYSNEQLYSDLRYLYRSVRDREDEDLEDAIADVMDFLTGLCAPGARLY